MHLPGYMFFHLLVGHGENSNPHKITPLHAACPLLQVDHLYSSTPVPTLDPRCECEQRPIRFRVQPFQSMDNYDNNIDNK